LFQQHNLICFKLGKQLITFVEGDNTVHPDINKRF